MLNTESWRKIVVNEQIEYMFDKFETVKEDVTSLLENKIRKINFYSKQKSLYDDSFSNAHLMLFELNRALRANNWSFDKFS